MSGGMMGLTRPEGPSESSKAPGLPAREQAARMAAQRIQKAPQPGGRYVPGETSPWRHAASRSACVQWKWPDHKYTLRCRQVRLPCLHGRKNGAGTPGASCKYRRRPGGKERLFVANAVSIHLVMAAKIAFFPELQRGCRPSGPSSSCVPAGPRRSGTARNTSRKAGAPHRGCGCRCLRRADGQPVWLPACPWCRTPG